LQINVQDILHGVSHDLPEMWTQNNNYDHIPKKQKEDLKIKSNTMETIQY
jgi:hypothetical protein